MKKIFTILSCLLALPAMAAEEPDFYADDFANQSLIWVVQGKDTPQKCQAVRIAPDWYLTAAHCVYPICRRECSVRVDLLNGELQAFAFVKHTQGNPHVFVPSSYHPRDNKSIRSDIALILFDTPEEEYTYVDAKHKQEVYREDFIKLLRKPEYAYQHNQWEALKTARPKLLSITNAVDRQVLYPIAVPDLRAGGEIYFKQSEGPNFYYFTQLRHYIGPNFGVEKGMSGSGVIVPGGAIIGVVSSSLTRSGRIPIYNEKDEPTGYLPFASNYFLFTPISQENASFINATINSSAKSKSRVDVSSNNAHYMQSVNAKLQDVFGEFSSEKEITQSKVRE